MPDPPNPHETKGNSWTPEDWKNLAEAIRPLLEEWIQFQKDRATAIEKRLDLISQHNRKLSNSLIAFL